MFSIFKKKKETREYILVDPSSGITPETFNNYNNKQGYLAINNLNGIRKLTVKEGQILLIDPSAGTDPKIFARIKRGVIFVQNIDGLRVI